MEWSICQALLPVFYGTLQKKLISHDSLKKDYFLRKQEKFILNFIKVLSKFLILSMLLGRRILSCLNLVGYNLISRS